MPHIQQYPFHHNVVTLMLLPLCLGRTVVTYISGRTHVFPPPPLTPYGSTNRTYANPLVCCVGVGLLQQSAYMMSSAAAAAAARYHKRLFCEVSALLGVKFCGSSSSSNSSSSSSLEGQQTI
jgi:hypothetical protein